MIAPTIDRALLLFLSGIIAGVLESAGVLDGGKHSDNVDVIQSVLGPLIIIVTLVLGYRHEKHKLSAGQVDEGTKFSLQPIFDGARSFFTLFVNQKLPKEAVVSTATSEEQQQ